MPEKTVGTLQEAIEYRAKNLAGQEAVSSIAALRVAYNRVKDNPNFVFTTNYENIVVTDMEGVAGVKQVTIPFSQFISHLERNLEDWLLDRNIDEQTSRLLGLVDQVEDIAAEQQKIADSNKRIAELQGELKALEVNQIDPAKVLGQ